MACRVQTTILIGLMVCACLIYLASAGIAFVLTYYLGFEGISVDMYMDFGSLGWFLLFFAIVGSVLLVLAVFTAGDSLFIFFAVISFFSYLVSTIRLFIFWNEYKEKIWIYIGSRYKFYPTTIEPISIDFAKSVEDLLLALGILQTIFLLVPASACIIEWKGSLYLLGLLLLNTIFALLPIYSAVITFSPVSGTFISLMDMKIYMIVIFVGGIIAVICFTALQFSLLLAGFYQYVFVAFVLSLAVSSITAFIYLQNPLGKRYASSLVGWEEKACQYVIYEMQSECQSTSFNTYGDDMEVPITLFSVPYMIVFVAGVIYIAAQFCCACGEAVAETAHDFITNSFEYVIYDENGKEVEKGTTGLWGRHAYWKE